MVVRFPSARTLSYDHFHGVGEAIAEPKQVAFGTPQQPLQLRAPLYEGLIAQLAALQLQQVEGVNACGQMPAMQQREEVWLTVTTGSDQLGIDDAGLRRQPEDRRGDRRVKSPPFRPKMVALASALWSCTL